MKFHVAVRLQPLYNPRAAKAFAALRRMEPALAKVNGTTYPTAQGMIDEAFAKEEVWITASYQVRTAGRACHTAVPPHGLETHSRCQVVPAITHATVSARVQHAWGGAGSRQRSLGPTPLPSRHGRGGARQTRQSARAVRAKNARDTLH